MKRRCLDCPALIERGSRCRSCELAWQRCRNARPSRAIYGGDWPKVRAAAIAAQPWCSNCYTDADLTVDGGPQHTLELTVLCRRCHARLENARRRANARRRESGGANERFAGRARIPATSDARVISA